MIEPNKSTEVNAGIKKRKQAKHAAQRLQPVLSTEPTQRRDSKRQCQKIKGPVAAATGKALDRVGA